LCRQRDQFEKGGTLEEKGFGSGWIAFFLAFASIGASKIDGGRLDSQTLRFCVHQAKEEKRCLDE